MPSRQPSVFSIVSDSPFRTPRGGKTGGRTDADSHDDVRRLAGRPDGERMGRPASAGAGGVSSSRCRSSDERAPRRTDGPTGRCAAADRSGRARRGAGPQPAAHGAAARIRDGAASSGAGARARAPKLRGADLAMAAQHVEPAQHEHVLVHRRSGAPWPRQAGAQRCGRQQGRRAGPCGDRHRGP